MKTNKGFYLAVLALGVAALIAACAMQSGDEPGRRAAVQIDADDIGGVVASAKGPEAGVWVIAETTELPTRFSRSVVTDDQGRYVLPDLPKANYSVWVRGYGLVDSPKVKAAPGKIVNLTAALAPNDAAAAEYYPAIYWYSMMKIPDKSEFGGTGKLPAKLTQNDYLNLMKSNGCANCHSIGVRAMRTFPQNVPFPLGKFANSEEAWFRRIQSGQGGVNMFANSMKQLGGVNIRYLADWTDRIAKGELPHAKPPRPQGVERNIVVTTWDWLDDKHYLHDLIASDRRFPTVNAYGPVYGSTELSVDIIPILDPKTHTVQELPGSRARRGYAGLDARKTDAAVALLGRRTRLEEQGQQPQWHVRSEGARVVRGGGARSRQPCVLQERLGSSLGQSFSHRAQQPPAIDARSQDHEVHLR